MKSYKAGIVMVVALVMAILGFMSCSSNSAKLVSITITPVDPVSVHGAVPLYQFTATGTFSDGLILNYTSEVIWSSSNPAVATVGTTAGTAGYVTVLTAGTTTITAIEPYNNFTSSSVLNVAPPTAITITPEKPVMTTGNSYQFTAVGTYLWSGATATQSLVSSSPSLTWKSTDIQIATVLNGLVTAGTTTGSVSITAEDVDSHVTGTATLLVTSGTLSYIEVTPSPASISKSGAGLQFAARGYYDDLTTGATITTLDLTGSANWYSTSTGTVIVSNTTDSKGFATGVDLGDAFIGATDPISNITGTASVTVTP